MHSATSNWPINACVLAQSMFTSSAKLLIKEYIHIFFIKDLPCIYIERNSMRSPFFFQFPQSKHESDLSWLIIFGKKAGWIMGKVGDMQGALAYTPYVRACYICYISRWDNASTCSSRDTKYQRESHFIAVSQSGTQEPTAHTIYYVIDFVTIQCHSNLVSVIRLAFQVHIAWSQFYYYDQT